MRMNITEIGLVASIPVTRLRVRDRIAVVSFGITNHDDSVLPTSFMSPRFLPITEIETREHGGEILSVKVSVKFGEDKVKTHVFPGHADVMVQLSAIEVYEMMQAVERGIEPDSEEDSEPESEKE